jgi:hypothetical protein
MDHGAEVSTPEPEPEEQALWRTGSYLQKHNRDAVGAARSASARPCQPGTPHTYSCRPPAAGWRVCDAGWRAGVRALALAQVLCRRRRAQEAWRCWRGPEAEVQKGRGAGAYCAGVGRCFCECGRPRHRTRSAQCDCVGGSGLRCGYGPVHLRLGVRRNGHRCRQVRRTSLGPLSAAPAEVRRLARGTLRGGRLPAAASSAERRGDSRLPGAERRDGSRLNSPLHRAGRRPR